MDRLGTWVARLRAVTVGLAISAAVAGTSLAGDLRVFSSGAPADAQKSIVAASAAWQAGTPGTGVALTVAMPAVLLARLAAGEGADVVVMPEQALAVLERQGKLLAGSQVAVARVGVGVVVRLGDKPPAIGTVAELRATLLATPSLVYPDPDSEGSVAGKAIARMLQQMEIAAAVKPKTTLRHAIGGGVDMVGRGEAGLGLFNISEILPVKGITLVGPLPKEVQNTITFGAAIVAGSSDVQRGQEYIRRLREIASAVHWQAAGLEPVGGK